jgi:GTP-sensing pleiotropic transcriptional regulator CodY
MTECRLTEEEPSSVEVENNQTYGQVIISPALSDNEDSDLHIQSMLKNLDELPIHVYRSMIAEDVTSSSNVISSEDRGYESAVLCTLDERQLAMKYPGFEVTSISNNCITQREDTKCLSEEERLFPVEAYSPMNRELKVKYEESEISHAFSQSVLTIRSVASRSRTLNSCTVQPNISESIYPVHSDSIYPIVYLGDDVCTEEEWDDNISFRHSAGGLEVSKDSLILSNVEAAVPHLRHKGFLTVPNRSPNLKRHLRIVRVKSSSNRSDTNTRVASKDEESLTLQPCTQVRGKQVDYSTSNNEDSMK